MTADSLIEVVQEAVERTGMTEVPLRDRTSLLSDNGPGYLSRVFSRYLWLLGIHHIVASPYHPQTNGIYEDSRGVKPSNRGRLFVGSARRPSIYSRSGPHDELFGRRGATTQA